MIIPHTKVTRDNVELMRDHIVSSIKSSTFVGLDVEFSGLGVDRQCRSDNIEERYQALCKHVSKYSILSFGISTFAKVEENENSGNHAVKYHCANYEILMVNQQPFVCDASSILFLAENGFDLNALALDGIPFCSKGSPQITKDVEILKYSDLLYQIFQEILDAQVPIVIHNGLLDLMFIYHTFYGPLPQNISTFVADLSGMFKSGGVFDTKFISSYEVREEKTYLAYLFRKYQVEQGKRRRNGQNYVECEVEGAVKVKVPRVNKDMSRVCESFMYHGHCRTGRNCQYSHDIDLVLRAESSSNGSLVGSNVRRNKKIRVIEVEIAGNQDSEEEYKSETDETVPVTGRTDCPHTAFYDAFMTCFVLCHQMISESGNSDQWKNRLYLMGKQIPLLVEKSKFTSFSKHYLEQITKK